MDTKQCLICAEHKQLNEFSKIKTGRSGIHPWCRDCLNEYFRARRAGQPTKARSPRAIPADMPELRAKAVGIYRIVHVPSGRAYIGASTDLVKRLGRHKWEIRGNYCGVREIEALFKRDGLDAFSFEVLAFCTEGELQELESALWARRIADSTSLNDFLAYRPGNLPPKS